MMFLQGSAGSLFAISQPAHAFVAGQLLRAWTEPLSPALLLATEQHDLAWLDWERAPTFDPTTHLPKRFLDVGAAEHAPRWAKAVDQALAAWGRHVTLLISRHGSLIYTRYTARHQVSAADGAAADAYLAEQAPQQAAWAEALGLGESELERDTGLVALADTLSLRLCGGLPVPLTASGPGPNGRPWHYEVERVGDAENTCSLRPWPFAGESVGVEIDAMPIPDGRFADEAAMQAWVTTGSRVPLRLNLVRGG